MANDKIEELANISLNDAVMKIQKEKAKILEEFAKAYLAETSFQPSEVEMVHQRMPIKDGIIENVIFFRKRA
jgi:hypothetical protein